MKVLFGILSVLFATSFVFAQDADMMEATLMIDDSQSVISIDVEVDLGVVENAMLVDAEDGQIIVNEDGVLFIPSEDFDGEAEISVVVCEEGEECTMQTITVTNESEMMSETDDGDYADVDLVVDSMEETIIDTIDDDQSVEIDEQPENGEVIVEDGEIVFIPDDEFEGVVEINYDVCESDGVCEERELTVYVKFSGRKSSLSISNMINPVCGDRVVSRATKETCDDGNKVNGDGCSSQCKIERNFRTTAIPTTTSIAVDSDTDVTYTVQKPTKDIDVLVAPYLNANEKIFLGFIDKYLEGKSTTRKMTIYKRIHDKFPAAAYKKYKMNENLMKIVLKAKLMNVSM